MRLLFFILLFPFLVHGQAVTINGTGRPITINASGKPAMRVNYDATPPGDLDRTIHEFGDDGSYNSFGNGVKVASNKVIYTYRQGATHLGNGRVNLYDFNIETGVWSNKRTIFPSSVSYDVRDPTIQIIDDTLYSFFCFCDPLDPDRTTLFAGYMKANDGLVGNSWGDTTSLPLEHNATIPWGRGDAGYVADEYFHPYWTAKFENPGKIFKVGIQKTDDNGSAWTQQTIYEGTIYDATETQVVKVGSNRMVSLSRIEMYFGDTAGIGQSVSLDGGATWSAMQRTNLGGTEANVIALHYHEAWGKLICLYQDRSTGYLKISITSVSSIISNPAGWATPTNYELNNDDDGGLGYPDIIPLGDDIFLVIWGIEEGGDAEFRWRFEDFRMFD